MPKVLEVEKILATVHNNILLTLLKFIAKRLWPQGVHNTKVLLCSSQQHDGHSTEMMRIAFSSRSTSNTISYVTVNEVSCTAVCRVCVSHE